MKFIDKLVDWASDKGLDVINIAIKVVLIGVLGAFIIHIINKLIDKALEKSKLEKAAHSLIKTLAKAVMVILLVLIIASTIGIDVTGIVALASVLTLAVSLALQNMLSNVIGGFTLLYTHPFRSGDFVEIASQSGTVSEIGIAYTKLVTFDNKLISIPNSAVVAAEIVNYTTMGTRLVNITVTASYDSDTKLVVKTLLDAVENENILKEPAKFAAVSNYGESSIEYTLRVWCEAKNYWDVYFSILSKLKITFEEAGIKMTYPHLNIHVDKE